MRQYIKLLVGLVTVISVCAGTLWLMAALVRAYNEPPVLDDIRQLGGIVERTDGEVRVNLYTAFVGDELREPEELSTMLVRLQEVPDLGRLSLRSASNIESCLPSLAKLSPLRTLILSDSHVTDRGVAHLQKLRNLRILDLNNTHITDSSIPILLSMRLDYLDVGRTKISDAGLERLRLHKTVRRLITGNEVAQFK